MKKLLLTLAAVLVSVSTFAQGTIVFNNRGLVDPATGANLNVPINGATEGASAQLFLVGGDGTYTPLPGQGGTSGINTFRAAPNQMYLSGPITVEVPGVAAGTTGVQVVMRAWQGASYDTATIRGESSVITVGALGGVPPVGAPVTPPTLGGAAPGQGLASFEVAVVPEPSTIALGVLGAAALLYRRRK